MKIRRPTEFLDQAAGLRRLMGFGQPFLPLGVCGTDPVLTSWATAHLAWALSQRGLPVWVVDEAPAPHNAGAGFGLPPARTLEEAVRAARPESAVSSIAPGLSLLAVRGGMSWLGSLPENHWRAAVQALTALPEQPHCLLLLAPPAAESRSLAMHTEERLLILPRRGRTTLTRAYALMKGLQRLHPAQRWHVLVMQARDASLARETFAALASTATRFLGITPHWLGSVPEDPALTQAHRQWVSVLELSPERPAAQAFRHIAEGLASRLQAAGRYPPEEFWLKMWMFSRLTTDPVPEKTPHVHPS